MERVTIKLTKKNDQVYAVLGESEPQEARIVWLRPFGGMGREVSILGKKEELVSLESLGELDPASRAIAEEELAKTYLLPEIRQIYKTSTQFGNRYFEVETNAGPRQFLLKNPYVSVRWISEDEVIIVDAMGNRFKIISVNALDAHSRAEFLKVL
jgi:hypothetical protein